MKRIKIKLLILTLFSQLTAAVILTGCLGSEVHVLYEQGTFPDTVVNILELNSAYDDYNTTNTQLNGYAILLFSTNRASSGGQFDIEQGVLSFIFDKTNGAFGLGAKITDDAFLAELIKKSVTPKNDFGPYRIYSALDGYEYMILSSVSNSGDLDFFYLKNRPPYGTNIPDIEGPFPVKLFNSSSDDAYISFDTNLDSAYFNTNISGNFDIYVHQRPADKNLQTWFNLDYAPSARVDSINSDFNDKCPNIFKNIMVFTSDRPGGFGGYDLYYSIFRNGKWNSPVNMGSEINSPKDEYRPLLGFHYDFTNYFMVFSSNRSGGMGGFDLYFTGVVFPKN
jgi:hypothetical protein